METIRLILIVGMLANAPGALTFEAKPVALEIALLAGIGVTFLIELWEET